MYGICIYSYVNKLLIRTDNTEFKMLNKIL